MSADHPETPMEDESLSMFNFNSTIVHRCILQVDKKKFQLIDKIEEREIEPITPSDSKRGMSESMLWHCRLGHASLDYLKKLQKIDARLKNIVFDKAVRLCEICQIANTQRIQFKED